MKNKEKGQVLQVFCDSTYRMSMGGDKKDINNIIDNFLRIKIKKEAIKNGK